MPAAAPAELRAEIILAHAAEVTPRLLKDFHDFRQRLAIQATRLVNGGEKEKEKAKALLNALEEASKLGTEAKLDYLVRMLTRKHAAKELGVLRDITRESNEIRADLKALATLLDKAGGKDRTKEPRLAELAQELSRLRKQALEQHRRLTPLRDRLLRQLLDD
jgi:hypothetical protein